MWHWTMRLFYFINQALENWDEPAIAKAQLGMAESYLLKYGGCVGEQVEQALILIKFLEGRLGRDNV